MRARRRFFAVVLALTAVHVICAVSLPLSGDEAYYWDCSRHLDWAYFDQPPLVIWCMAGSRLVLGESRLAVRAPAIVASLLTALLLVPLLRRLGGGAREAAWAYLVLHAMPGYFLGAFYASTDALMTAAWVGATWAGVAIAQGEHRGWWGFGAAVGLGFLAKFPIVLVALVLLPVIVRSPLRPHPLRSARPYLAAAVAAVITLPVWIWAVGHDFDNISFQLGRRLEPAQPTLRFIIEFLLSNAVLATPFILAALAVAWVIRFRAAGPGWRVVLISAAAPLVVFSLLALRSRVGAHWGAPGLVVAAGVLAMTCFRWRRALVVAGALAGLGLVALVIAVVTAPEPLMEREWSYPGRPRRITTDKLAALVGNRELVERVAELRRNDELVASESYATVHLLAFLSAGSLPTRLAHIKDGKHGLASLYWHRPDELRGRNMLFVTRKTGVDARLAELFEEVEEEEVFEVRGRTRVLRRVRLLRCRNLLYPEGAFTRLE